VTGNQKLFALLLNYAGSLNISVFSFGMDIKHGYELKELNHQRINTRRNGNEIREAARNPEEEERETGEQGRGFDRQGAQEDSRVRRRWRKQQVRAEAETGAQSQFSDSICCETRDS
jgi:predicted phage gp36 major capsid-like protein